MQRYTIFNKNNRIFLTNSLDTIDKETYDTIINCNSEVLQTMDFKPYFKEDCIENLALVCESVSTEEMFVKLSQNHYVVFAAGGIVRNEKNEVLFMYRNGMWDLPKGHWERGEAMETTAKREVMEECGLQNLSIGKFVCNTLHTYYMHRRFELKQTAWYEMFCPSTEKLCPQQEEGIKELRWVGEKDLPYILSHAYPNIANIFTNL